MGLFQDLLVHTSPLKLLYSALALYTVYYLVKRLDEARRIRKHGGRGTSVTSYVPLGLDRLYSGVKATMNHKNKEQWEDLFANNKNHTVEVRIIGMRIVFTDEPENIKAILATQFKDFGMKIYHKSRPMANSE
jgi:hypothetical protein